MPSFVRKNVVTIAVTFTASDGTLTQPAAARAVLAYKDHSGIGQMATIDLTHILGSWLGTWDTSAAAEGAVHWMVYGYGTLQAAAQGTFEVAANQANIA